MAFKQNLSFFQCVMLTALIALFGASACVHAQEAAQTNEDAFEDPFFGSEPEEETSKPDPLESYNRFMFSANLAVDKAIFRPVAASYKKVMPDAGRNGIGNFFGNLNEPWIAANLLLQGRVVDATKSLGRFSINTLTSLGFVDVAAAEFDLIVSKEDFGQTLGTWGVPAGPYMVLPVYGPSSVRNTAGRFVDGFGKPIGQIQNLPTKLGMVGLYGLDKRAKLLALEGFVDTENYELVRDVYLQKREYDITNTSKPNKSNSDSHDSGFDESFGD